MHAPTQRGHLTKWWAVSLLLVLAAEAVVCGILFVPQSVAMERAKQQKDYVEGQLRKVRRTHETFRALMNQVNEAGEILAELNAFTDVPAQDIVMNAIEAATGPSSVVLVELARETHAAQEESEKGGDKSDTEDEGELLTESWRLRCKGSFRDLMSFLNSLETQGLLFDRDSLQLDATEEGLIELEVVMKAWTSIRGVGAPFGTRDQEQ
jgi:hypothetical protein